MEEITLQQLLEAGCHFGHKAERWNPRAKEFIYTEKDGIHIIDLAKTKVGLERAAEFVRTSVAGGEEVLFVGTKRQAKGIVKDEAVRVSAPYFAERWIGGFMTNWDEIKKNIEKINRLTAEEISGAWKKFPKHEQMKLSRYLHRLRNYYSGVLTLKVLPKILFVVDVRKESSAVREARRKDAPIIAIVDTNSDPLPIDYVIPANDDAVGSIGLIVHHIANAYEQGKKLYSVKLESEAEAARESEKDKMTKKGETAAIPRKTEQTQPAGDVKSKAVTDTKTVSAPVPAPSKRTKQVKAKEG